MRKALQKNKDKKFHVFYGTIDEACPYGRQLLKDVSIMDESGNNVVGNIDHVLTSKKPFKGIRANEKVRFTGKISVYTRADGSQDYQIIVNKAVSLRNFLRNRTEAGLQG